ncbi:MAG TPA: type III pantothenate kinase [Stellaceae bacterium]|jgi:type III pantothenate kinase|nr:type III pantothenate kinase [Stellaceae bacterium]
MLLAIDSGNTNVVCAVYAGDDLRGSWRAATNPNRTADEYAVWLIQVMALAGLVPSDIDATIIGSVVPEATFNLTRLCQRYFVSEPLIVGRPGCSVGIGVDLEMPEAEVGADRLANAVAAQDRYRPPLIVIDFGTATTFDVVDRLGNYSGGVIAPGINLSLRALDMAAAQLPRIGIRRPLTVVGRSTVPAMQSGVFWGYVGLVEGLVQRIRAERGEAMEVTATGGLAPVLAEATDVINHVDPDLTLWGLRLIYRRNCNK